MRIADEQDLNRFTLCPLRIYDASQTSDLNVTGYTSDICTAERFWTKFALYSNSRHTGPMHDIQLEPKCIPRQESVMPSALHAECYNGDPYDIADLTLPSSIPSRLSGLCRFASGPSRPAAAAFLFSFSR